MGGKYSQRTTTLIKPDGSQEPGFDLKYDTYYACAIPDEDTVIITGGRYTRNTVSVYSVEGWQEDLPPLNTERSYHACSSYMSGERRVFMVTGGYTESGSTLDTTETLASDEDTWTTTAAKLPRPMRGLRAATIDDRVLIFGGLYNSHYYDDILEYNPDEDSMVVVGHLTQARAYHAVSVVQAQDYTKWCQ